MRNFLSAFILGTFVSFFLFPISFTFLPESVNTKMILGAVGTAFFAMNCIRDKYILFSREVIISALFAAVFSLWCYFCEMENGTSDGSYTTYFVSFAVWLGAAYAVVSAMKLHYGKVDLALITRYLTAVCVFQCVAALLIKNIPAVQRVVDSVVDQGQAFYVSVRRMYGLGAALDPAGIRFALVLTMIAHQLAVNESIQERKRDSYLYIFAFLFISVIGNMIARTTLVGTTIGLAYLGLHVFNIRRGEISKDRVQLFSALVILIALAAGVSFWLYQSNMAFRADLRFAFEAFFNWMETGEFRTDSTDKLNTVMWVWPKTSRAWAIGTGLFGNFIYSTDIGYCRFTLYCGLIGLGIFSLFFATNALMVRNKFHQFHIMTAILIAMTFIIWFKVATDIFFLNALLFCIDPDET